MKPENIFLIQREGQPHFVKILDFGIAKVMGLDPNGPRLTRTGMIFGTPEYMAPEQAEGKDTDHRADIYAVGCIMYHLITGQTPFVAESFMTMLTKHLMEDPVPPSVRRPDLVITPEMDALVLKALEKDRDKRWQSMAELLEAVAVCPGPPSDAGPKAPGGQTVEMGGAHAAAALRVLRAKGQETERISRRAVDSALASSAEMAAEVGIRKGKKIVLVIAGVVVGVGVAIWLAMSRGQPPVPPVPAAVTAPPPAPVTAPPPTPVPPPAPEPEPAAAPTPVAEKPPVPEPAPRHSSRRKGKVGAKPATAVTATPAAAPVTPAPKPAPPPTPGELKPFPKL
jgi:serine/threonine-protein kinase